MRVAIVLYFTCCGLFPATALGLDVDAGTASAQAPTAAAAESAVAPASPTTEGASATSAQAPAAAAAAASTQPAVTPASAAVRASDSGRPALTRPAPARRFGDAGVLAIAGETGLEALFSTSITRRTLLRFAPSADVFVVRNFSLGGALLISYLNFDEENFVSPGGEISPTLEQHTTEWSVGPRAGFNLELASIASLYLKAGASFGHTRTQLFEKLGGGYAPFSSTFVSVEIAAPLLLHVVPHFFIGLGPEFTVDLKRSAPDTARFGFGKGSTLRLALTLGGWL